MFLTQEELKKLTGYARHTKQIEQLKKQGYRFKVNALGQPLVLKAHVEELLLNQKANTKTKGRIEPDVDGLTRLMGLS